MQLGQGDNQEKKSVIILKSCGTCLPDKGILLLFLITKMNKKSLYISRAARIAFSICNDLYYHRMIYIFFNFVQKSRRKIHILDQACYWLTSGPTVICLQKLSMEVLLHCLTTMMSMWISQRSFNNWNKIQRTQV